MKISSVYIYANGNIMVFDDTKTQVIELQKKGLSGLHEINELKDENTEIGFSDFRSGNFIPISNEALEYLLKHIKKSK